MLQQKYIQLLSGQLKGFVRKGPTLYNCRCPLCGDSKKSSKKRGFIMKHKATWFYKCHNCGIALPFEALLKRINESLWKEMLFEKLGGAKKAPVIKNHTKPKFEPRIFDEERVEDLSPDHPARQYLDGRMIPLKNLYYTSEFFAFVNKHLPGKFPYIKEDQERIIIPMFDAQGILFGIQGRALDPLAELKYITIKFDEDAEKIFGLDKIKRGDIYVFEGSFDSIYIENSIATTDSNYVKAIKVFDKKRLIVVPDTDVRNKQVVHSVNMCIKSGLRVSLLPQDAGKDINEMIQNGMSKESVKRLIDDHTYSGMRLRMEFNRWKKV